LSNNDKPDIFQNKYYILGLFSLLPVLNFTSFNLGESGFSLSRAAFYVFCIAGIAFSVSLALKLIFPKLSSKFIALFIGLSVLTTFYGYLIDNFVFGTFLQELGIRPRIMYVGLLYILSICICALLSFYISRKKTLLSIIVFAFSAVAFVDVYPVVTSINTYLSNQNKLIQKPKEPVVAGQTDIDANSNIAKQPNVYFILPDMMFGSEMFEKYNIDKNILNGLGKRGFNIIDKTYSNAPVTEFSIPHIFTMEHYLQDGATFSTAQLHKVRDSSRENNRVVEEFKKRGYTNYAIADGYIDMCARGDYICFRNTEHDKYQQQDMRFIERTPFFKILNVLDMKFNLFTTPMNLWPYPNRIEVPDLLPYVKESRSQPYFMYIHLGLPHFPLRFDRDCNYKRFDKTEVGYAEQYQCAVKYLELLVDEIIDMDEDALIVMHADHGVMVHNQHMKQVEELSEEEIIESLSIFSAFRVPEQCKNYITNDMTPVNTFRFVFACLDNTMPQYVENKSFLVYYPKWPSGGKVREWIH
jgi:sulfatase-like protein